MSVLGSELSARDQLIKPPRCGVSTDPNRDHRPAIEELAKSVKQGLVASGLGLSRLRGEDAAIVVGLAFLLLLAAGRALGFVATSFNLVPASLLDRPFRNGLCECRT